MKTPKLWQPDGPTFSSGQTFGSTEWETPPRFFDFVNREFDFQLDAAASAINFKCDRYITKTQDALVTPWRGDRVWLNPPYGRGIIDPFKIGRASCRERVYVLV